MLDPKESLRLENIFIDLKNQGKSLEDIIRNLNVVKQDIILEWNKNYESAMSSISESSLPNTLIKEKDSDGKYIFVKSVSFGIKTLDGIKLGLRNHFLPIDETSTEYHKEIVTKAMEAYEILDKYVEDVKIDDNKDNNFSCTYTLKTEGDEIKEKVDKALMFYGKTIHSDIRKIKQSRILIKKTPNESAIATNSLPIAVKTIAIKNYIGIKDILIENLFVDSKWIFITGENGFGKTVFLQALAIGLNGTKDGDTNLIEDYTSHINIEFKRYNDSFINNIWSSFEKLDELACYGPSRLQVNTEESKNEGSKKNTTTYSLFNPNGLLFDIEFELMISKLSNPELFETYCNIFKKLIPSLESIIVNEGERKVYYIEKDLENKVPFKNQVRFNQLASGIRSLIAMVGDMIIRLKKHQPNIINFSELAGIVIIDEIDLHWHPKWQREIPKILSEIFPNIQFIASTHSPLPLLGAPENSIFLKVERSFEDGIKCRKVDINIKELMPNALYTSPLFDMDNITNVNIKSLAEVETTDDYKEIEAQKIMKNKIDKFETGNEKFPDELFK